MLQDVYPIVFSVFVPFCDFYLPLTCWPREVVMFLFPFCFRQDFKPKHCVYYNLKSFGLGWYS